ncbi:NUDIX hydrolase domain-like protein [Thamnidium elegans]|nr:NUDIX hydrolase domain-like protein [Thamnidium elegans]
MSSDSGNVFEAAAAGDLKFLEKNVKLLNEKNERGWTSLHFAARFGHLQVATFLKEHHVDLNHINNEGKTASQVAAFWGNDQIAKLLTVEKPDTTTIVTSSSSPYPDNYTAIFAGNPLNRYGWNRGKPDILAPLARSSKSNYIVLNKLKALYNEDGDIHYVKYDQVASIVDHVFTDEGFNKTNTDTILVFMGIDEREDTDGEAYWALDVTPKGKNEAEYIKLIQGFESNSLEFIPTLPRAFIMDKNVSSMIAQAAAMVDWNARNMFCAACGKRTVLEEAGHKRSCISDTQQETKCISHTGIQNFAYPRTDAVVIVCIVHPSGDKILLGRNKRWPKKMFSCISGFVEAAETLEEAVRREVYEEAGVIVDRVAYHSSQPWVI